MKECFPGAQKSTDSQELTRLGDQVMTDSGPKGWLSALTDDGSGNRISSYMGYGAS
jgi:hypothetical protein